MRTDKLSNIQLTAKRGFLVSMDRQEFKDHPLDMRQTCESGYEFSFSFSFLRYWGL